MRLLANGRLLDVVELPESVMVFAGFRVGWLATSDCFSRLSVTNCERFDEGSN